MNFWIEKLVLWPLDIRNERVELEFEAGKVNIVHGRSGTGKSSIIAIIDYCLGANRCAIPVGTIREDVEWFGLVLRVQGKRVLIARRTPGERQTSKEFYIDPDNEDIPENIEQSHNDVQFKNAFNNLVQLTNLPMSNGLEIGQFDGRPSYRDLAAFNFLPQHIVANPNTLFYKADSYEHKERLKRVMPFALGITDSEYVAKERERAQLQRLHDELVSQRDLLLRSMKTWDGDVLRLWDEAVELGLVKDNSALSTEYRIQKFGELNRMFLQDGLTTILSTPNFAHTNERYKVIQAEEEDLQKRVDASRREVRGLEQLAIRANDFKGAVSRERKRVINLDWLKSKLGSENECVVCGSHSNQLTEVISKLDAEMNRVDTLSRAMFENPVVDKEVEAAKNRLNASSHELHLKRAHRAHLQTIDASTKDSLSRVYVLLGRIQSVIAAFATLNNTDTTSDQLAVFVKQLRDLDVFFQRSGKAIREAAVDKEISNLIEIYSEAFPLERRGAIQLDKQELTLSFRQFPNAKKEYLWEVGSGANWMGYHIATFLALHEFLAVDGRAHLPVFSFLVIDQPSQVYFPSAASGANDLDFDDGKANRIKTHRDEDITATKRIFEMLEIGLKRSEYQYQMIVLEHADQSIWGGCENTVQVANWKAEGDGLIPRTWIRSTGR